MKVALTIIMCSLLKVECLPPYTLSTTYNNFYDCMNAGYQKSLEKTQEIGRIIINKELVYFRFSCTQVPGTDA